MLGTEENGRKRAPLHLQRRHLLIRNSRQLQSLLPFEIRLRKDWVQDYICKQIERRFQVRFQRIEIHTRKIEIRTGVELRAQPLQLIADFERSSLLCSSRQQRRGKARCARQRKLIGGIASVQFQPETHDWDLMTLGQQNVEAV